MLATYLRDPFSNGRATSDAQQWRANERSTRRSFIMRRTPFRPRHGAHARWRSRRVGNSVRMLWGQSNWRGFCEEPAPDRTCCTTTRMREDATVPQQKGPQTRDPGSRELVRMVQTFLRQHQLPTGSCMRVRYAVRPLFVGGLALTEALRSG